MVWDGLEKGKAQHFIVPENLVAFPLPSLPCYVCTYISARTVWMEYRFVRPSIIITPFHFSRPPSPDSNPMPHILQLRPSQMRSALSYTVIYLY